MNRCRLLSLFLRFSRFLPCCLKLDLFQVVLLQFVPMADLFSERALLPLTRDLPYGPEDIELLWVQGRDLVPRVSEEDGKKVNKVEVQAISSECLTSELISKYPSPWKGQSSLEK